MDNRNKLRQVKKQIKNRKIHRKKENNNRTRTSISHTYLFNILIGLKHDAEEQITRKPKETTKYKYIYKTNINTLIGNIKEELPRLLTDNQEEIQIIVKEIIDMAKKDLVYTKTKPPTNEERDKKNFYHKKCKSNIQDSF